MVQPIECKRATTIVIAPHTFLQQMLAFQQKYNFER